MIAERVGQPGSSPTGKISEALAYVPSPEGSQKLIVLDLDTNRLLDYIVIPNEIAPYRTSFLNDLVVDNRNGFVYITDSG